jgi:hypothetical protein
MGDRLHRKRSAMPLRPISRGDISRDPSKELQIRPVSLTHPLDGSEVQRLTGYSPPVPHGAVLEPLVGNLGQTENDPRWPRVAIDRVDRACHGGGFRKGCASMDESVLSGFARFERLRTVGEMSADRSASATADRSFSSARRRPARAACTPGFLPGRRCRGSFATLRVLARPRPRLPHQRSS